MDKVSNEMCDNRLKNTSNYEIQHGYSELKKCESQIISTHAFQLRFSQGLRSAFQAVGVWKGVP